MTPAPALLIREAFKTSRLADFASQKELVTQTGHAVPDWPLVLLKEGVDNAIDACEDVGVAPAIDISVDAAAGEFVITDNGPGIAAETVDGLVDYSVRVSTREAYVSPSRGRQGNALQTLLAMAFALDGEHDESLIEAGGIAHLVRFTIDPVTLEPLVGVDRAPSSVNNGTRMTLRWPAKACNLIAAAGPRFLPLVEAYATWNPHVSLRFSLNGEIVLDLEATAPTWSKWRGSDPIPVHWFDPQTFVRLLAAQVDRDRQLGRRSRPLRQVIGDFHGLSGNAKRAAILAEVSAERSPLAEFYLDGERVNTIRVHRLLRAMRRHSRPVKAAALGVIGREHFHRAIIGEGGDADTFRYHKTEAEGSDGLPFVVEAGFASKKQQHDNRQVLAGINWSASIAGAPLRFPDFGSIDQVLASQRVHYTSPVIVAVHLATPLPSFADRGKAAMWLTRDQAKAVVKALARVTEEWNKARAAEEKARAARDRRIAETVKAIVREKRRRERDEVVGSGVLHNVIAEAAAVCGTSITNLTVLSPANDPFRRDTRDGHIEGRWVAEQLLGGRRVHVRGFHYLLVVAGNSVKPDGTIYQNADDDWLWLQDAVRNARWLKYVPFDQFTDERNEEPFVYMPTESSSGEGYLASQADIEMPLAFEGAPRAVASPAITAQPYRLVMIGEKSSLRDVLLPIAEQVGTELLLPTGEASDVMIADMAARAAVDGRPTKVVYFSDFDPSGWQMPISVSAKLLALRHLYFPNLDIEVHRAALTVDQVKDLGLPSTPLKRTERRGDKWRARWGHEQTEIDALATVRPAELDRIALAALAPFYDPTLMQRNAARAAWWCRAAEQRLTTHPATAAASETMQAAYDTLRIAVQQFDDARREAFQKLSEQVGIRHRAFRRRRVRIEAAAPEPLFSSRDDYATAARKLITSKALAGPLDGVEP